MIIAWMSFTYRLEKFPLQWDREACGDEGDGICTSWVNEWIVSFTNQESHSGAQVCFNGLPGGGKSFERIYVFSYEGGFSAGNMYFDKEGQFLSDDGSDDTGQFYQNGIYVGNITDENPPKTWKSSLDQCTFIPEWFFNMKVDRDSVPVEE